MPSSKVEVACGPFATRSGSVRAAAPQRRTIPRMTRRCRVEMLDPRPAATAITLSAGAPNVRTLCPVACPSGRRGTPGERVGGQPPRGFESRGHRQVASEVLRVPLERARNTHPDVLVHAASAGSRLRRQAGRLQPATVELAERRLQKGASESATPVRTLDGQLLNPTLVVVNEA